MLETLTWIAAITAVPVAVVGWFTSGAGRTPESIVSKGGTATSGDMHVENAGIVTGHNSHVEVSLAVSRDAQDADRYQRRHAIFQAITISMGALPPGDEKARASAAAGEQRLWPIKQIDGLSKRFESVLHF
jgi:hypothetical protein